MPTLAACMWPVQMSDHRGPLSGLRVLELGSFIAGPFAGQLLGDYGAEIIKIEPPGTGDAMRHWGVTRGGASLWWPTIARNKKSVALDLRVPAGQRLARALATRCDIVLENFRPGRLRSWGLDYATLAVDNPGLIMVHVSGFGQTGPRATAAGFGSIGEAFGGIRHTTGDPDRPPARCGISLGDQLASLFAVIGALAALSERYRSGTGQEVDVAIYEAVFALMESSLADFELADIVRSRSGSTLPGVAPSNAYPTSDGADVIIAANADAVFRRLCEAMGRTDLAADERFSTHVARGQHMTELDEIIGGWSASESADSVLAALDAAAVPASRVFTAADMLEDEQYLARGMVQRRRSREGWRVPMSGVVPTFTRTAGAIRDTGPRLGEHTAHVLAALDIATEQEARQLATDGVIEVAAHD